MSDVYLATGEFINKNINEKFSNIHNSTINVCGNYICGTSTNGDMYRCVPPCHGNEWELVDKKNPALTIDVNDEQFYKKCYEKLLKDNSGNNKIKINDCNLMNGNKIKINDGNLINGNRIKINDGNYIKIHDCGQMNGNQTIGNTGNQTIGNTGNQMIGNTGNQMKINTGNQMIGNQMIVNTGNQMIGNTGNQMKMNDGNYIKNGNQLKIDEVNLINEKHKKKEAEEQQKKIDEEEKQKKKAVEEKQKREEEIKKGKEDEKKKKIEIEKDNEKLFGNLKACDKYKEDEINISHECWDKLWKSARCITNPPKMEDHKNLTLKEVRELTDEYATKNNKIYRQACYGDESKYPAVRLYITDKNNLKDGNYTPINFSIGVHSTHNFIVNSIIISPDHKVSIYKNEDLSGEFRTFFHSVSNLDDFKMKDEGKFWHDNIKALQVEKIQPIIVKNYCIDYEPNDYVTEKACINQLWKDNGCTDGYPTTLNDRLTFDVLKKEIKKIGNGKDDKSMKLCYGFDKEKWPNNNKNKNKMNIAVSKDSYKPTLFKINNNETCKDKCNSVKECVAYNSSSKYECYLFTPNNSNPSNCKKN